jgi:hypothetical protein
MPKRLFISHISDEAAVAERLKGAFSRDFLGLLDVFVSSDTESIAAGEDWLRSIERALEESAILLILCSPSSVKRPWINFEAGAAWMRKIPIIPVCHDRLTPRDLPMPLSLRQGVRLDDPDGLRRLYSRLAEVLSCQIPSRSFKELAGELLGRATPSRTGAVAGDLNRERQIRKRLMDALQHHRFRWRSVDRLAAEAGISQDLTVDLLRADPDVRFSKGKSGKMIVAMRSRIG